MEIWLSYKNRIKLLYLVALADRFYLNLRVIGSFNRYELLNNLLRKCVRVRPHAKDRKADQWLEIKTGAHVLFDSKRTY